ncbi:MAG: hypothetical protein BWY72_02530 [Bacteroidetes bacterium ADurb.Bin416]|nr:MAG: hypothetical protein BWY72_02530 [Bacteroidetes bacterium ADurb.Bin416]
MSHTIGVNRCTGGFQVGIRFIQELMPKAKTSLKSSQGFRMRTEKLKDSRTIRVLSRQYVQYITERQNGPAIGASPEKSGVGVHVLNPTMPEQSLGGDKHLFFEEQDLSGCLINITRVTGVPGIFYQGRQAHVHIVQPHGVNKRTIPGKLAVGQTVFLSENEIHVIVN